MFFFYSTPLHPCPYRPGHSERKLATDLRDNGGERLHNTLSRAGFRRSHSIAYLPACPDCKACVPVRIDVANFRPSRTMRKIYNRNADLLYTFASPHASLEHYKLFSAYQEHRHASGDMVNMTQKDFTSMVEDSPIETYITEFRTINGILHAACLTDKMDDGLSAVYSYYSEAEPRRSLGSYMVLALIERTRAFNLPYLYLGYWVPECRKMSYKTKYNALEGLIDGHWQAINISPEEYIP